MVQLVSRLIFQVDFKSEEGNLKFSMCVRVVTLALSIVPEVLLFQMFNLSLNLFLKGILDINIELEHICNRFEFPALTRQIFVVPVLECDTSVTAAAIQHTFSLTRVS